MEFDYYSEEQFGFRKNRQGRGQRFKSILVTNGTMDFTGSTKANTEAGYIRAAKRVWPYHGVSRVKIRITDNTLRGDPIVYEAKIAVTK